jgi:hypothetical protein
MTDIKFVTAKVSLGLYINPKLTLSKEDALVAYQRLQSLPDFDGFSTYNPPQEYTLLGTTLGTLTSSNNVLKAELSQTALLLHWSNVARASTYRVEGNESFKLFITRVIEAIGKDIGGAVVYQEFLLDPSKSVVEGILMPGRRKQLKNLMASLTYPGKMEGFSDLDVTYTITDSITDEDWKNTYPELKYSLSGNTSMRFDPDRILKTEEIKSYLSQALKEYTGPRLLADITDDSE